jgi:26S proteasome regulatory subunit N8
MSDNKPQVVIVHPLVLLAVVDHYGRSTLSTQDKRVVGALLGERKPNGVIDVCNCYAIPFEEDVKDPNIWYLDHIYNETLVQMY